MEDIGEDWYLWTLSRRARSNRSVRLVRYIAVAGGGRCIHKRLRPIRPDVSCLPVDAEGWSAGFGTDYRYGCSDASGCSSGCKSRRWNLPSCHVAISGGGASDQAVGSPEVKASVGWGKPWSAPTREASKSTGCSESELQLCPEMGFPTRIGGWGRWKCRDFPYTSKARVIGEGTGCRQLRSFPGSQETTCR